MILPSFGLAAGSAEEEAAGHAQPSNTPLQDLILQALRARSQIMFSGESGAAIVSGIKEDAATAEKPSYGLVRAAMSIVFNELPDVLFDQHAEHRPCGVLDRYEAVGMLIGDALGLPLMPRRPHALNAGTDAQKRNKEIPAEQEKARKAARRKGEDPAAAAAAVLRQTVKLRLPSAEQCTAAPAPEQPAEAAPPLHDGAPALEPGAPALELPPAPPPAPASESEPAWLRQWRQAKLVMFTAAFDGSKEPAAAIRAAMECEENDELDANSDSEGSNWEEEKDLAVTRYKHALRKLRKAFPDERCDWTDDGVCKSTVEACVCRRPNADQAGWPWVLQRPAYLYCWCECERGVKNKQTERQMWLWATEQGEAGRAGEERDMERFEALCSQL